jgi:hypothetical protein
MLGLAQGMTPVELGLDLHQTSCKPFLDILKGDGKVWWNKNVKDSENIDVVGGQ